MIGRKLPTEKLKTTPLYKMRIFAPDVIVAKSRFWYFLRQLRKFKKTTGEIVSLKLVIIYSTHSQILEKNYFSFQTNNVIRMNHITHSILLNANCLYSSTDSRKVTYENKEFWNLAEVRLSIWYTQHVQRIQRFICEWCSHPVLPRHGSTSSCQSPLHTNNQGRNCQSC